MKQDVIINGAHYIISRPHSNSLVLMLQTMWFKKRSSDAMDMNVNSQDTAQGE